MAPHGPSHLHWQDYGQWTMESHPWQVFVDHLSIDEVRIWLRSPWALPPPSPPYDQSNLSSWWCFFMMIFSKTSPPCSLLINMGLLLGKLIGLQQFEANEAHSWIFHSTHACNLFAWDSHSFIRMDYCAHKANSYKYMVSVTLSGVRRSEWKCTCKACFWCDPQLHLESKLLEPFAIWRYHLTRDIEDVKPLKQAKL